MAAPATRLPLAAELHARLLLGGSLVLLLGVPVGIFIGNDIIIGFGGALGGSGLLIGLLLRHKNRRHRVMLDAMASGDCLARWTYSDAQWAAHVADTHARRDRFFWRGLAIGALIGGAAAAVVGVVNLFNPHIAPAELWPPVAVIFAMAVTLMLAIGAALKTAQIIDHRRLARTPGFVLIGRQGLYRNSTFWPNHGGSPRLQDLRIEDAPMILVFGYRVQQPRGGPYVETLRIPVPPGSEREAREVVAELRGAIRN
jgi:hypothetical protein